MRLFRDTIVRRGMAVILLCVLFLPVVVAAQTSGTQEAEVCQITDFDKAIKLQLQIPGVTQERGDGYYIKNLGCYIVGIYRYFIGVAAILSTVFIMYGGVRYVISTGNPSQIQGAKDTISSALVGLLIAIGSYSILFFINPNLTRFDYNFDNTIPRIDKQTIWCKEGDKVKENFAATCGNPGIVQGTNQECVWTGGCTSGKICVYTAAGPYNGYDCVIPQLACEEYARLEGDDACKFVDDAFAAQGVNGYACSKKNTRVTNMSVTSSTTNVVSSCVYEKLLACGGLDLAVRGFIGLQGFWQIGSDKDWERISCANGETSGNASRIVLGCWKNGAPLSKVDQRDNTHGGQVITGTVSNTIRTCSDTIRIAENAGNSICCADVLDIDCRDASDGCNDNETDVTDTSGATPRCILTRLGLPSEDLTAAGRGCTQSQLNDGMRCCVQVELRDSN